jgi:hypothetical protein
VECGDLKCGESQGRKLGISEQTVTCLSVGEVRSDWNPRSPQRGGVAVQGLLGATDSLDQLPHEAIATCAELADQLPLPH